MSVAALLLAALLPATFPPAPEPTPAFVSLFEAPEPAPLPPSIEQQAFTRSMQVAGGTTCGIGGACLGSLAALLPAYIFAAGDSGDVGSGTLVLGAAIGYSYGVGWAIRSAGSELGGCEGSILMASMGAGASLMLTAAALNSGLIPLTVESVIAATLAPPVAGILAFELTRTAPCVRKPVGEEALVTALLTAVIGAYYVHAYAHVDPADSRSVFAPLMQIRW